MPPTPPSSRRRWLPFLREPRRLRPRESNAITSDESEDTMRVFVTGASGAIGSRLVPQLIDAGHEVIGTHNSPASAESLRTYGAKPVMVDLLDAGAVRKVVLEN